MHDEVRYKHLAQIPGLTLSSAHFSGFRFEPHYHLDFHIALVTEGVMRQSFRGESFALTRGVIQMMPSGEVHDGVPKDNESYTLQTFRLSTELLHRLGEEITGKHYFPSQAAVALRDSELADQLQQIHSSLQRSPHDLLMSDTLVLNLLESLFARLKQPAPQSVSGALTQIQLLRVRDYMEAHLCEKIVLDDLAQLVGMDRFRFLKLFKQTIGMTPHAWLLRLRLEKAMELIKRQRELTIADVAHAVGFFDQSHFSRAFRSAYGVTPSRF
ncbi:hypothetical protein P245_24960 [Comamonas thiooxydans]|uniref:HTH araC/xylS-type domain-containing protein n=1 Tax=Comamonas thiooxydans TaxID=363952 RepID=A0A0E3B7K3_9BURK|nr:AraC family transcriptional regulator [Comamonas thiooxydans]KGG83718.1 hypothetical protein P245_24960 [Comamonas thiooxydans]